MRCDLCGIEENLFCAVVEGAELNVCLKCAKYGKVLKRVFPEAPAKSKPAKIEIVKREAPEETIVENYAQLIRAAREKSSLKQEDIAKKIAEKESLLHNIETGKNMPSLKVAQKLEKLFKIKLVEIVGNPAFSGKKVINGPVTIGDMIQIRRR